MAASHYMFPTARLACLFAASQLAVAAADNAPHVVFKGGHTIPLSALALQGDKLVVKTAGDGFNAGQIFPLISADHVYGDKPAAINQGIALLLMDKPKDAQKLLEPLIAEHRLSAKISGNFWLEAARALLVACALNGDARTCAALGKEISDTTPVQGMDSFVTLGKALLLPPSTKADDRLIALRDLTADTLPPETRAFAFFYYGSLCKKEKRAPEALEAYLSVSGVVPTGGMVLNAAGEIQAADLLTALERREEATALLTSVARDAPGTILVDEAHKRLESIK